MKHTFLVHAENINDGFVSFSKKQKNKIINVLRLKDSDFVRVCDGKGKEYTVNIKNGKIVDCKSYKKKDKIFIRLLLSLTKLSSFEYSLQKSVEIGVDEIIPVITKRSVVKIKDKEKKQKRFLEIIKSAFCQSGRIFMPELKNTVNELYKIPDYDGLKIVFYEQEKENSFKKILSEKKDIKEISILIGPEGGFDEKEIISLRKNNFVVSKLTENILRSETAVIFALSNLNFFYGI